MPDFLTLSLALFFAWLFAVAAGHKLRHVAWYLPILKRYLGGRTVSPSAVLAVAAVEATIAACVLLPLTRGAGFAAAALAFIIYAAMMQLQIHRGRADEACGCSGPAADTRISPSLVLRNVLCALLAATGLMATGTAAAMPFTALVVAVLIAVFLAVVYLAAEQLLANAQAMRRMPT